MLSGAAGDGPADGYAGIEDVGAAALVPRLRISVFHGATPATATYLHDFELGTGGKPSPRATVHYETRSFLTYFDGDDPRRYANPARVNGGCGKGFDEQTPYAKLDLALSCTAPVGGRVRLNL